MKVITVASYYGTGSSAVTDYISEFKDVKSLTDYEFRFAHDPDGLSELEYNLIENFNRHNSGHALKRYKDIVDYYGNHFCVKRYEPYFNGNWKKLSYEYINSLVDFSYKGRWQFDFYDKGRWYEFWHKFPERIMHKTFWRKKPDKHVGMNRGVLYASHPTEKEFLEKTRDYTDKLIKSANPENLPYVILDQLVPSTNIERHARYFNNLKVFLVDRDPRDIYLLNKFEWKCGMVPTDVETFIKWFKYTRSPRKTEDFNPDRVMFVKFEDLVYNYEETTSKIAEFIGLSKENHINPKKLFNPSVSIKNTKTWEKYQTEDIKLIEKELKEYLYQY